jgi:putative phosphoesterase
MLIGVVSDTHGNLVNTQKAVRMLESLQVEQVLHCGDIGAAEIPPLFRRWPTHFVLGNVDHRDGGVKTAIAASGVFHDRFGDLTVGERRIALLHSDDRRRFLATIESGDYDLVCYGHSHIAEQHRQGRTLVLNPGALHRANPHSLAVVDLSLMQATIVPLQ